MTKDDIIRMAREAGFGEYMGLFGCDQIERFAALVVAHEREQEMKAAEKAIYVAIGLEREACAKVCDAEGIEWDSDNQISEKNYAAYCAEAIRARNVDSVDTSPECVEKAAKSIHNTSDELAEKDCGAHHHRYVGSFGD